MRSDSGIDSRGAGNMVMALVANTAGASCSDGDCLTALILVNQELSFWGSRRCSQVFLMFSNSPQLALADVGTVRGPTSTSWDS
jgi:hypothetical protein